MTFLKYPDGRQIDYDYGTSGSQNDRLSRIENLDDSEGSLTSYQYAGIGQIISAEYTEPDLTYSIPGGMSGVYTGLDRFGRLTALQWKKGTAKPVAFEYGYDRRGNRLFEKDTSTVVHGSGAMRVDALLEFDGLDRLVDFQRGTLNSTKDTITSPNLTQDWTLDQTGNWDEFNQGVANAGSQTRTHNEVNEITGITVTSGSAWDDPAHDANGNMTTIPKPTDLSSTFTAKWDAWDRLVELKDGSTLVAKYEYDGTNRRVVIKDFNSSGVLTDTNHLYLSTSAQVLEEHIESSTLARQQYIWGLRFVDDLIFRDRDVARNGVLEERLYALHDLRVSVVALADPSGIVRERYTFDAYGRRTTMDNRFILRANSSYAWEFAYTGRRRDIETALYFFRARYYNAELGRFVGRDPLQFVDGMSLYRGYFVPGAIDPLGRALYSIDGTWANEEDESHRTGYSNVHAFHVESKEVPKFYYGGTGTYNYGGYYLFGGTGGDIYRIMNAAFDQICKDFCDYYKCHNKRLDINLVGWSRGAVAAVEIADWLDYYGCTCESSQHWHIDVNFLGLLDPVEMVWAIGTRFENTIPSNVQVSYALWRTDPKVGIYPQKRYTNLTKEEKFYRHLYVGKHRGQLVKYDTSHGDVGRNAQALERHLKPAAIANGVRF